MRSPRHRQGAGHRRSAATSEDCPSAPGLPRPLPSTGPRRPSTAPSSSPSATDGARSFSRAPIALLRPLTLPGAPQPARAGGPAPTCSRTVAARARSRVRAPLSRAPDKVLSSTASSSALACPGAARGKPEQTASCGDAAVRAASARPSPSRPQRNFFASSPR